MTATWTSHYEASGLMWWTLEDTDWIVERVRLDDGRYVYECRLDTDWIVERVRRGDGRYVYECRLGDVGFAARKSDLVIAQRFCERNGAALVMPWEAS
jgi:hypothetical protein